MRKKQFKAESKRLLDLMINSIYTHKEIFLREIISNASDAIDKLCYLSLTDDKVGLTRDQFAITITRDKENRTLTVSDNGIGMSKEEMEENLGTIAKSGSLDFKTENQSDNIDIIGQFGVGFYSAFMVAQKVTVISRAQGADTAWKWESKGVEGYTITEADKDDVGTEIILVLKDDTDSENYSEYLDDYTIANLVKKYSDYIRFPIKMLLPHSVKKPDSPDDKPEYDTVYEWETLNSMVPLWQRKKSEVTKEEYDEFYQQRFGEMAPPQSVISVSAEGAVTYKALLFIPSKVPNLYYTQDFKPGLQLYSAGVMIMDHCQELLPEYFSFVRGVVDSPDLSLNISRELLQHDRQLKIISGNLEKKIIAELKKMLTDDRAGYEKFYENFGRALKVGVLNQFGEKRESLQELLLFYSSTEKKLVTLREYADRMPESQEYIYYAAGDTVASIDSLPQTELLKERGMEILYCTDRADEFLADSLRTYDGKEFRSAVDGDLGLEDEPKPQESESDKECLTFIKETLGDRVDEVKASQKLKSHPVCMTSGEGLTFEMEKYFRAVQPELSMKAKRILEVNVAHPAFLKLESVRATDPELAKKYAEVLYNQALLIAGLPLADPSGYTDLVCSLWS